MGLCAAPPSEKRSTLSYMIFITENSGSGLLYLNLLPVKRNSILDGRIWCQLLQVVDGGRRRAAALNAYLWR